MEGDDDVPSECDGDETITLREIVAGGEVTLKEEELWALCLECCLTLEFVHNTKDLFQSLIITPETVAFDRDGNVCFLDLDSDPDPLYFPPEYKENNLTYKSHLYSLGMTLLFSAEYAANPQDEEEASQSSLSQDIMDLLTHLTQNDPGNRPDIDLVLEYCDRALGDISSQDVCRRFACVTGQDDPEKEGNSLLSMTEDLAAYLQKQSGLVTPAHYSSNNNSDSECSIQHSDLKQQTCSSETQVDAEQMTEVEDKSVHLQENSDNVSSKPGNLDMKETQSLCDESNNPPGRSKRRQGLLLLEILDALDRFLCEVELLALCQECIKSLQRKKKYLPAYISLDTVMIREIGSVSFKAIPEDKSLQVQYMAPELQQKGILNEKTCLYGLGMTLKLASGQRNGSIEQDARLGTSCKTLIASLLQASPELRPSLEVALLACNQYDEQTTADSQSLCRQIYMKACTSKSAQGLRKSNLLPDDDHEDSSLDQELQNSWLELKEERFLDEELEEKKHKASAFQPISSKNQFTSLEPAFQSLSLRSSKPSEEVKTGDSHSGSPASQISFPHAFSSPATHFKPIVLQGSVVTTSRHGPDLQESGKEKNKPNEIKKNLLKQPSASSPSKVVLVDDTKAEKSKPIDDAQRGSGVGKSEGVLESLLQQMQHSGRMPDTQNLAQAIAKHLQEKLGQAGEAENGGSKHTQSSSFQTTETQEASGTKKSSPAAEQISFEAAPPKIFLVNTQNSWRNMQELSMETQPMLYPQASQSRSAPNSMVLPNFAGSVVSFAVPSIGQTGFLGQGISMPVMSLAGGIMPGPLHYQLQQDPSTGLVQLVPVSMVPYGSQNGLSCSTFTSGTSQSCSPWQQNVSVNTGLVSSYSVDGEDVAQKHTNRPSVNSRSARGLIQKTAAQRARNVAGASCSPTGYHSDIGSTVSKSSSYFQGDFLSNCGKLQSKETSQQRRFNSLSDSSPLKNLHMREEASNQNEINDSHILQDHLEAEVSKDRVYQRNANMDVNQVSQILQSSSQMSTPSPSKDSGIFLTHSAAASGMSSTSLMEKLLSSESLHHQQTVSQVLDILNQGFGDQGPDNFHSEELLAEYIMSLSHLKWETFMHAVTEKYPNFGWSHSLLTDLFQAVNGQSASVKFSSKPHPTSGVQPLKQNQQEVLSLPEQEAGTSPRTSKLPQQHVMETEEETFSSVPNYGQDHPSISRDRHKENNEPAIGHPSALLEGRGHRHSSQSAVHVLASGQYIHGPSETSDSTDNEKQDKRRRFKKRYELDRNKSLSLHNIPGMTKCSPFLEQRELSSALAGSLVSNTQDICTKAALLPENTSTIKVAKSLSIACKREGDCLEPGARSPSLAYSVSGHHSLPRSPNLLQFQHTHSSQSLKLNRDRIISSHSNASEPTASYSETNRFITSHPEAISREDHDVVRMNRAITREAQNALKMKRAISCGISRTNHDSVGMNPAVSTGMSRTNFDTVGVNPAISGMSRPNQDTVGVNPAISGMSRPNQDTVGVNPAISGMSRPNQNTVGVNPAISEMSRTNQDTVGVNATILSRMSSTAYHSKSPAQQVQHSDNMYNSKSQSVYNQSLVRPIRHSPSHQPHNHSSTGNSFSHSNKGSHSGNLLTAQDGHLTDSQANSHSVVYGQHGQSVGKSQNNANSRFSRSLTNMPLTADSDHDQMDIRNMSTMPLPVQAFDTQCEVNNNVHKSQVVGREVPGNSTSQKNQDHALSQPKVQQQVKPLLAWDKENVKYMKKGQVVHHSAMLQLNKTPDVEHFIREIDRASKAVLMSKLSSIEQEMMVQRRQRRKSQNLYERLKESASKQWKGIPTSFNLTPDAGVFSNITPGDHELPPATEDGCVSDSFETCKRVQDVYINMSAGVVVLRSLEDCAIVPLGVSLSTVPPMAVESDAGENKVDQVLKDISEMTGRLKYLNLCHTHLQMLLSEQSGLNTSFLPALITRGSGKVDENQALVLQPYQENIWLQFQAVREAATGHKFQVLQAGHSQGLLSYLFTRSALSEGYVHQFLFCFRYFLKAEDVFSFICQKYLSARRGNQNDDNIASVQQRATDLLQFWIEGYYSVDFERNGALPDLLEAFVMQLVEEGVDGSQNLRSLVCACHLGENTELVSHSNDQEDRDEIYYQYLAAPKRWESFRSLLGHKKPASIAKSANKETAGLSHKGKDGLVEKRLPVRAEEGSTLSLSRHSDMQLMDYSPDRLAEQLTLMEQEVFQRTHPVHYLDSKAQGIGVDLSIPSQQTPSMRRKSKPEARSLFVGTHRFESRVSDMILHSQEITHWVSAEVLCCGSQKTQVITLTKFLNTAQRCMKIHNYATALAILAGLDNLLVRQLSAWKHLPAKGATLVEDLEALQVKIKSEPMALMQDRDSDSCPTIPCVLYFLLHLQQLEIGGFTLANGMYKWPKMRSICQMIDQIRIFKEHEYGFEPDYELQSIICRRLQELSDRDLHTLAAAHDSNFRRVMSTAGIQGTWRKVKVKLQSRTK